MTKRSRTLRYKVLMGIVLLAVVGWSAFWFMVATVVDRQAEKAENAARSAGAIAECVQRNISGYPFSIEVRCAAGSRLGDGNASVTVDGLTAAALIYKPSRLILETQGPATVSADGFPEISADWELAHASARVDLGNTALERFDVEVRKGLVAVGGNLPVPFEELDVNVRENPADNGALDVALHAVGIAPASGSVPLTLLLRGTLSHGAPLLAGRPADVVRALATDGLTFVIERADVETADLTIATSGELTLGANGLLDGALDVAVAGEPAALPLVNVVFPEAQDTIATLVGNVLAFAPTTTIGGQPAKKLRLTVRNGQVSAGIVPLFAIPPVRFPNAF